jgi:hypothetical protein
VTKRRNSWKNHVSCIATERISEHQEIIQLKVEEAPVDHIEDAMTHILQTPDFLLKNEAMKDLLGFKRLPSSLFFLQV